MDAGSWCGGIVRHRTPGGKDHTGSIYCARLSGAEVALAWSRPARDRLQRCTGLTAIDGQSPFFRAIEEARRVAGASLTVGESISMCSGRVTARLHSRQSNPPRDWRGIQIMSRKPKLFGTVAPYASQNARHAD
jgi:hypothetical protein